MRHKGSIAALSAALCVAGSSAWACSCSRWDPKAHANEAATIFVAEVEHYDKSQSRIVDWAEQRAVKGIPVRLRVLETLKGTPPPDGEMVAVGFEITCAPTFREGDRRILLLSKAQQNYLHLCSERLAEPGKIEELRAALRKK